MRRSHGLSILQVVLVSVVVAGLVGAARANPVIVDADITPAQASEYRLNDDVLPSKYVVTLTPYLHAEANHEEWTFDGHVIIDVEAQVANLREMTLHSNDLILRSCRIYSLSNPNVDIFESWSNTSATHKLTLKTFSILEMGRTYRIEIEYQGFMRADMAGFYRSTYMERGVEKRLGSTQFQTTSARRAFPCWDEPKYKAVFEIHIKHLINQNTISNMRKAIEHQSIPGTNRFLDSYKPTPRMSTYIIAFIVSEYQSLTNADKSFGVWSRPEMVQEGQYALDVGIELLDHFDKYTAYPYYSVMEKMDMAAVPDFSAGAMENWGLLTYRETNILYNENYTTLMTKQRIAAVIAHEQIHMWFGDLVTCDWWSYTWLNEGFARYHQYMGTAKAEKDWDLEYQFVVEQVQGVFHMDSTNSTHPMNHDVNTPAQISNIFDNISYNKGASVIRMIEHLMGPAKFLLGIQNYLKENEFQTAVPEKLYSALQAQSDPSVYIPTIMGSWADQEGYPVLDVKIAEDGSTAALSQRRFLLQNPKHSDTKLYPIPITFANKNGARFDDTTHKLILSTQTGDVNVNSGDSWTIFNVQEVGYYRVNYDENNWNKIIAGLKKENFDGIHVINRAQIVNDVMSLARGGLAEYQLVFDVLDYLAKERHYIPWYSALDALSYVSRRMVGSNYFKQYIQALVAPIFEHVGFERKSTDSQTDIYLRSSVLTWACKFDVEACLEGAKAEFEKHYQDSTYLIDVNIRQSVLCTGIRLSNATVWDWLWNRYVNENMATEQIILLNALGCTDNEEALYKYLDNIFSDAIRSQDKSAAFTSTFAGHDNNIERVWNYLVDKRDKVVGHMGSYGNLASYMSSLSTRFTERAQITRMEEFAKTHEAILGTAVNTLNAAVNSANYEQYWSSLHYATIEQVLQEKLDDGAAATFFSLTLIVFGVIASRLLA